MPLLKFQPSYEGCRDLHRSISVVRAVRFMNLWWVRYVARVALKFSRNFLGETTGTSKEKWVKNMDRCSGRTEYSLFIKMSIVWVGQSRKPCSIPNRGKRFFSFPERPDVASLPPPSRSIITWFLLLEQGGQDVKLTSHLHPVRRIRMGTAIPQFSLQLHGIH